MKVKNIFRILIIICLLSTVNTIQAQSGKFKVVLDAGHGGKDPGNSYHGFVEKSIAFETTMLVGEILEKHSDIKIIYTRKSDVFIELKERANIANRNDADLFVSIHCNAHKTFGPNGTETFVMGMGRADMNLDVAKRENSVIFLEDNYKEKYNGFDPDKPESLIGLKILQEEYLSQSIELASRIEINFSDKLKRNSRGVKQQLIWVLDATTMPSVLVELGFLSNKTEGGYLNSSKGKAEMAEAIANAILDYKKEFYQENTNSNIVIEETKDDKPEIKLISGVVFKVQISASSRKLDTKPSNFKKLSPISREQEGKLYKYFYGEENSYDSAKNKLEEAKSKGYNSAFIVAYKDGVKISVADAIK